MISSKKGQEMYSSVSPIYENSKLMQSIFNAIGNEADLSVELGDEILRQLFPQTADSWGLSIWEQRLGLVTNISESIEKRRKKIIAKFQTKFIITPERMAFIIKNYTGIEPLIEENVAPYTFDVYLKTYTMFSDILSDVHNVIKTIKPSHLAYNLIMQYITNVIINISSKEWFSDTIPLCGTLDDSGNLFVATNGITYNEKFIDNLKKYYSNTLLLASQKVYPSGSLGKSFNEKISDSKKYYFSNTLRLASDNTVMNFTYGISKKDIIVDKLCSYNSAKLQIVSDNNFICMINGLSKTEKVVDKYSKYFSEPFQMVTGTDGLRKKEYITDKLSSYNSVAFKEASASNFTYMSDGKVENEKIIDSYKEYFSEPFKVAIGTDGVNRKEYIIDKCSTYLSLNILQCSSNIYCGGGVYA